MLQSKRACCALRTQIVNSVGYDNFRISDFDLLPLQGLIPCRFSISEFVAGSRRLWRAAAVLRGAGRLRGVAAVGDSRSGRRDGTAVTKQHSGR